MSLGWDWTIEKVILLIFENMKTCFLTSNCSSRYFIDFFLNSFFHKLVEEALFEIILTKTDCNVMSKSES